MLYINGKKHFSPDESSITPGYVYVISNGSDRFKIGKSINPEKRLKSLTLGDKGKIIVKNYYSEYNYSHIEKELHTIFRNKKISGEWFELSESDIEIIRNYKIK